MDGLDGLKQWTCKNGHVLGVIRREPVSSNGAKSYETRLIKYRNAIDLTVERPADVEVDCEPEGTVHDVRCNIPGCGEMRTWWAGRAGLERLLEGMGLELKDEEKSAVKGD